MLAIDQPLSNETDRTVAEAIPYTPQPRRTKPPGSGRKPGTPNRVTRDIREAAAKHGPKALQALVKLLDAPDPKIRTNAAREILDRAYGRPVSPTELTGKDGGPVAVEDISDASAVSRMLYLLAKAKKEAGGSLSTLRDAKPAAAAPFPIERDRLAIEEQQSVARAEREAREEADAAVGAHWMGDRKIYPGGREEHGLAPTQPRVITARNRRL